MRSMSMTRTSRGKSNCDEACAAMWIPLSARSDAKPLGDWTLVARKDGSKQWAYKGRPVYTLIHDDAEKPKGDGMPTSGMCAQALLIRPHRLQETPPPVFGEIVTLHGVAPFAEMCVACGSGTPR